MPFSCSFTTSVNDQDFAKLVAVLRCAVPYTGMRILVMRGRPLHLGVSQMSAGSRSEASLALVVWQWSFTPFRKVLLHL